MNPDKLENFVREQRADFDQAEPPTDLWSRIEAQIDSGDHGGPDPLATFIRKNRTAFDTETPPPRLFDAIVPVPSAEMSPLRVVGGSRRRWARVQRILAIAAAVVLVFGVAYTVGNNAGYATGHQDAVAEEMNRIDPEAVETEQFYQQEIATHARRVSQLSDDPQLQADLAEIDQATAELRAELLEVPVQQRPELVRQLIENYQIKLDVLLRIERQLSDRLRALPDPKSTNHDDI